MRLSQVVRVTVAVVCAGFVLSPAVASAQPSARPHYPVSYEYRDAAVAEARNPAAAPLGANDWACKPSTLHAEPVVLVHGGGNTRLLDWSALAPLLANNGYCVFALTYGLLPNTPAPLGLVGGMTPIEHGAQELGDFTDRVLAATGADHVDIVDHSQGSLVSDYYAKFLGGADKIDRLISLGTLWHGTNTLESATLLTQRATEQGLQLSVDALMGPICPPCLQIQHDSAFIAKLTSGGAAVPGVTYTDIITSNDEFVIPYTSGYLPAPNATDHVIQDYCPGDRTEHTLLPYDTVAAQLVLNALDPSHAERPTCTSSPPNS